MPAADDATLGVHQLQPLSSLRVEDVGVTDASVRLEGGRGGRRGEPADRQQQHQADNRPVHGRGGYGSLPPQLHAGLPLRRDPTARGRTAVRSLGSWPVTYALTLLSPGFVSTWSTVWSKTAFGSKRLS